MSDADRIQKLQDEIFKTQVKNILGILVHFCLDTISKRTGTVGERKQEFETALASVG
jgi:hypothetical protein